MQLPFSTKKQIDACEARYVEDQTGAQRLVEKYLIDLKETVAARKTRETPGGYLHYTELYDLVYWKLKRSRWIGMNSKSFVKEVTSEAFSLDDDWEKLNRLTDLKGVGEPVASVILHLCDQKKYPILDKYALCSVWIDYNEVSYDAEFWQKYVDFCRKEAKRYNVSMRTLDRALWKYSTVDLQEDEEFRLRCYYPYGGKLGVTIDGKEQIRLTTGVDTYVKVIERIGIERVRSLKMKYGEHLIIDDVNRSTPFHEIKYKKSGRYYIKSPGNIYRFAIVLKQIATRLDVDLIVDYLK